MGKVLVLGRGAYIILGRGVQEGIDSTVETDMSLRALVFLGSVRVQGARKA